MWVLRVWPVSQMLLDDGQPQHIGVLIIFYRHFEAYLSDWKREEI